MNQVLCSTGTMIVHANGRNYHLLAEMVPQIQADGLEFMMYESWHGGDEPGLLQALAPHRTPVFHMTKIIGQWISEDKLPDAVAMFRADCGMAAAMGAKLLVLHLWSGRASDQHIERNIAAYPVLREIAEEHGLLLTVENVLCNTHNPMRHMRALVEKYPDISFTFDTKMAAFHSELEALYRTENAWLWPRIAHFHVNDYAGGHMDWANMRAKPLGTGHIDFDRFFAFVRQMGYQGDFTYEAWTLHEDGRVRYDDLNACLGRIRAGLQREE
ncbi:MAG: sugar phosphate isomerase/epimerase [Clostridia bacterium]|nr:sugar phosphate isomerase/epimerase [Clostridia bacterium]